MKIHPPANADKALWCQLVSQITARLTHHVSWLRKQLRSQIPYLHEVNFFRKGFRIALFVAVAAVAAVRPAVAADMLKVPPFEREIFAKEREVWRKVIGWSDECEEAFQITIGSKRSGVVFHDLGGGCRLAEIACAAGAYQGSFIFAGIDISRKPLCGGLLTFPTFQSLDGEKLERRESREMWGTITFDPKTRILTVINRFRGLGDCGTYVVYRFLKGAPVLKEARGKSECDGLGMEHPEQWPRIKEAGR